MGTLALGVIKRLLILSLLGGGVAAFGAYQYFDKWLNTPLELGGEGMLYQLESGGSLSQVVRELAGRDILEHPQMLLVYARLSDKAQVRAGEYRFAPGTTPSQLVTLLNTGSVVEYAVTLIEGWTFAQAVEALAESPKINAQLSGKSPSQQLAILDLPIEHPEGWFFPDTYRYTAGTTDVAILHRAYEKMHDTLERLWLTRADNLPYSTAYEALTMASIVERETGAAWERQKIAGVFVRRLRKNMRLQTDPTVIYGMGSQYRGKIGRADLRRDTPYNTYVHRGLPPTPIALPGEEAIYAALHPEAGEELYFVAKGDGTHVFSSTLAAHNDAVRRYQLQRRSDYRSAPAPEQDGKSDSQ